MDNPAIETPAGNPQRPKPSWAAIGTFLILAFAAATLARSFLMPLTLAILLFFVFAPACRGAARLGVPQALSATLVTLALLAGLVVATVLLAVPLASALDNAPKIFSAVEAKLAAIDGGIEEIQDAIAEIQGAPAEAAVAGSEPNRLNGTAILTDIATTTPALFGQLIFTLVLLFFALASRELLYKRIVQSFSAIRDKQEALTAMHAIEESLGHYLGAITLINAALGIAVGLAMWAWGMPAPALFGVAAFAFNFVPYVGAIAGVVVATLVALVTMDGFLMPVLVGVTYLALTAAEGQIVTPYFISQRLRLSTVVVFIEVALFAWLWSIVGMIVAVPLLVVLNVICRYIPSLSGLGTFLSGEADDDGFDERIPDAEAELPATHRTAEPDRAM